MTDELIEAARRLTGVLADENAALGAFDIRAATQLLDEKRGAADAFVAACRTAAPEGRDEALDELRDAARVNQRLLERAIAVQARVIAIVARAIPRAAAPVYGADGGLRGQHRTLPMTLSARA